MEIFTRQFGLLIAFLLPGFVALAGVAPLVPAVAGWLHADQTASFGAPVYALLAATAAGMVVSCFRWLLVDQILVLAGVPEPDFNARALEERPAAVQFLVQNHYVFYQFYANSVVAVAWSYSIHRWLMRSSRLGYGTDLAVLVLCAVLFAGSRDAISKYRNRSRQLAAHIRVIDWNGELMTNGVDHNLGSHANPGKPAAQPKPDPKPETPAKPHEPPYGGKQSGR